jgi:hypothetical protein
MVYEACVRTAFEGLIFSPLTNRGSAKMESSSLTGPQLRPSPPLDKGSCSLTGIETFTQVEELVRGHLRMQGGHL